MHDCYVLPHAGPTRRSSDLCQGQLAEELPLRQRLHRHLPAGGEDAPRDRQVEAAAVLGQVGGGEVDGDRALRELELRATDRGAHRSEEHTSELPSLMRIPYALFCFHTTPTTPCRCT